jgi:hypothetical protein
MFAAVCLLPCAAQAKSWKNVVPGQTPGAQVLKRFGEPTTRLAEGQKQVLAYEGDEAIAGTKQAQFIVGPDGKVEQIAVFPATVIEKAAIADTFGPDCSQKQAPNCYVQKVNDDDFKTYYWYENLGLVIFFDADGKTVGSLLYVKPGPAKSAASATKSAPAPGKTATR